MCKEKEFVFQGLHVIAWIIFVGLCIEASALIVNFVVSLYKPEILENLYQKLDISDIYSRNKYAFYGMYSFVLVIAILKAYLFYIVISLMHKLDMAKPFNDYVAKQVSKISYNTFSIGLISYIAHQSTNRLENHGYDINKLSEFWADSQAFILMSAVIYIIAYIFTKGVELQNENDLTV